MRNDDSTKNGLDQYVREDEATMREPASHGIYININKVVVIVDKNTGRAYEIDPMKAKFAKLRRRVFAWAAVTDSRQTELGNTYALIQLSYRDNQTWQAGDITSYIQAVIGEVGKDNVYDYGWVLEVKPVGRNLHYHLALHINPKVLIPYPDSSGMWVHGSSNLHRGKSSPYYLCKYTAKLEQKWGPEFPKGARSYCVWLNQTYYQGDDLWEVRKAAYPKWLVAKIEDNGLSKASIRRSKGGGWLVVSYDKLHPLYGVPVLFEGDFYVLMGYDEISRMLPTLKGVLKNVE